MGQQATEATIAGIAQKVGVSGAGVAVYGGWSANEIAAFGGLLVGIIGVVVAWYFKRKEDRRNQLLHDIRMRHYSGDRE